MGKNTYNSGDYIYRSSDRISSLGIILSGSVTLSNGITLGNGYIMGLSGIPGDIYGCDYKCNTETTVFSYPYEHVTDIIKIININPKICNYLASACVSVTHQLLSLYEEKYKTVIDLCEEVSLEYQKYQMFTDNADTIPDIENIQKPDHFDNAEWEIQFINELYENNDKLKAEVYPLGTGICTSLILNVSNILKNTYSEFTSLTRAESKLTTIGDSLSIKMHSSAGTGKSDSSPRIENAIDVILNYSKLDSNFLLKFKELIITFKSKKDRNDTSDETRLLKKDITKYFYSLYTSVFLQAIKTKELPIEVRMFLYFGFVDEELAGEENTEQLALFAANYVKDPNKRIFTVYEWLQLIYTMKVDPSKNEFDMDYFEYLRDEVRSGNLTEAKSKTLQNDPRSRLDYEIKNIFTQGNRMTFGRILSFVPVFDSQNALRPLDASYVDAQKIMETIDYVRSIDYSCFCREAVYSNPNIGITQEYIQQEVLPNFILMPNFGTRAALWQEIVGKKRTTPARMLLPIFVGDELEKYIIQLCAEFRWDLCKRVQGVHWNDVTDPSLTSMFCDYLQFYRKNHDITPEVREKVKLQLTKANNNYRTVFVSDYYAYIKFEVMGSPRLNKISRDIIFTYCPPVAEKRNRLAENPQYADVIKHFNARMAQRRRVIDNLIHRLTKEDHSVPKEIKELQLFLNK
ncbi:MAG: hypothetical protein K6F99_01320 [Lachnospiraceae bacterium]|nr:hypothetical protein [Lachnospiraceae bacterium]